MIHAEHAINPAYYAAMVLTLDEGLHAAVLGDDRAAYQALCVSKGIAGTWLQAILDQYDSAREVPQ